MNGWLTQMVRSRRCQNWVTNDIELFYFTSHITFDIFWTKNNLIYSKSDPHDMGPKLFGWPPIWFLLLLQGVRVGSCVALHSCWTWSLLFDQQIHEGVWGTLRNPHCCAVHSTISQGLGFINEHLNCTRLKPVITTAKRFWIFHNKFVCKFGVRRDERFINKHLNCTR